MLIGGDCRSAVGTLVERTTRYVLLLHLPDGHNAYGVERAMRQAISALPAELRRSITWDQGKEMAQHAQFTISTGIQVYFCDPHRPWQRGSNEVTNGLLRQYMPKGTDLSVHTAEDLAGYARSLSNRPRKTPDYMKPSERVAAGGRRCVVRFSPGHPTGEPLAQAHRADEVWRVPDLIDTGLGCQFGEFPES